MARLRQGYSGQPSPSNMSEGWRPAGLEPATPSLEGQIRLVEPASDQSFAGTTATRRCHAFAAEAITTTLPLSRSIGIDFRARAHGL